LVDLSKGEENAMMLSVKNDAGAEVFSYDTKRDFGQRGALQLNPGDPNNRDMVSAIRDALQNLHDVLMKMPSPIFRKKVLRP
jgi:hypothetical protein